MDVKSLDAANAYASAANAAGSAGIAGGDVVGGKSGAAGAFSSMVEDLAGTLVESTQKSEAVSLQAAAGKADLVDVVTAVNNAEMALETVVAVRDKVIAAYNDIMKMPI